MVVSYEPIGVTMNLLAVALTSLLAVGQTAYAVIKASDVMVGID